MNNDRLVNAIEELTEQMKINSEKLNKNLDEIEFALQLLVLSYAHLDIKNEIKTLELKKEKVNIDNNFWEEFQDVYGKAISSLKSHLKEHKKIKEETEKINVTNLKG